MARVVTGVFDVVGSVLDVQSAPTKNGKLKYDVSFSDGNKYTTFLRPLAEKAAALKGVQGTVLRIEQSQNGEWTNFDLEEVNPLGTAPATGNVSTTSSGIGNISAPAAITPAPARDFEKETRGKVRHGAIIAGLEAAARTSQGESDSDLFKRAIKFATAVEAYVFEQLAVAETVAAEAPTPAPEPEKPSVEALVEQGVVQVGTSGLPWGQGE